MKKSILLLLAHLPLISFTQVTFSFENGSTDGWRFTPAGRWAIESPEAISGNYSLHHVYNNTTAASDAASFSIKDLCPSCSAVTWSFKIRHGYAPSASNKWAFVLASDLSPASLIAATGYNGFVAGVNLSGNDDTLRLYKVKGTTLTRVITSGINWEKDIGLSSSAMINVVRNTAGLWKLKVAAPNGDIYGEWEGSEVTEPDPVSAGIVYSYTASADQLLWIDDVSVAGAFIADIEPPVIEDVAVSSDNVVVVSFSEEIKDKMLPPASVSLSSAEIALTSEWVSSCCYKISFAGSFLNKTENILKITNLCDESGNCAAEVNFKFTPSFAEAGDVIINEIMFDPVPSAGLPEEEYVELINLSGFSFSTDGWMLIAGSDTSFLPEKNLHGDEIVILCGYSDTLVFKQFGRVIGVKSFPSLNDTGEKIALRDAGGRLLHAVDFGPELYNDNARSGGGWSVEMTDTDYPFNSPDVWIASGNPAGGSPGQKNSVVTNTPDLSLPQLLTAFPHDSKSIELWFNETMKNAFMAEGFGTDGLTVVSVKSLDIADMSFLIEFDALFGQNKIYSLSLPAGMADFAGNRPSASVVWFGVPQKASAGEILFNEVLFNPVSPCTDYIELFNNSSFVIDLAGYYFTSTKPDTGEESVAVKACSFPRLVLPGELAVLTTEKGALCDYYSCSANEMIYETDELPSMPDDEGIIKLYNKDFIVVDRFAYNSSMHLVFISNDEGISLEKVSPLLPSGIKANWHSASESCNWGSPGTANSVLLPSDPADNGVSLSSDRVSPDGDGYEDVVSVDVFPGGEDNVVSISIFNDSGDLIRKLADRFYSGSGSHFVWDGTDDNNELVKRGLYLVSVTVYNPNGEVHHWKKVCAVVYM